MPDLIPAAITDSYVLRALLAAVLGGLIGFERDVHGRAAGLRTHLLVSLGSALFTLVSIEIALLAAPEARVADPGRVAAQIVTGIGFLGAGAIIKKGFSIRGLTTAACLWIVAGIGMAAGAGLFEIALLVSLLSLITLVLLNMLERLYRKDSYRHLRLVTDCAGEASQVIDIVQRDGVMVLFTDIERDLQRDRMTLTLTLRLFHKGVTDKLSHQILREIEASKLPLYAVKWYNR